MTRSKAGGGRKSTALGVGLGVLLLLPEPVRAERVCFPENFQMPTVDGTVFGDVGYRNAFREGFADGTPDSQGAVQLVRDPARSVVHLSFEVFTDPSYDPDDDVVLLAWDTGISGAARYRRLEVYPVVNHGAAGAHPPDAGFPPGKEHPPYKVVYYTSPTALQNWNPIASEGVGLTSTNPLPAGIEIGVDSGASTVAPGTFRYQVELRLPTAAYNIPTNSDFAFYSNMILADSTVPQPIALQLRFPTSSPRMNGTSLTGLPSPDTWGIASLSGKCAGVSIDTADIQCVVASPGSTTMPAGALGGTEIAVNRPNFFRATVRNDPLAPPANAVRATFRIANFGSTFGPADAWGLLPIPAPTSPPSGVIPAGGAADLVVGPWNLNGTEVAKYTTNSHQCIYVDLEAGPGVALARKAIYANMNFKSFSSWTDRPEINMERFGKPAGGAAEHEMHFYVQRRLRFAYSDGRTGVPKDTLTSELLWTFRPFRYVGSTITVRRQLRNFEPGPAFAYLAQHASIAAESLRFEEENERVVGKYLRAMRNASPAGPGLTALSAGRAEKLAWRAAIAAVLNEDLTSTGLSARFNDDRGEPIRLSELGLGADVTVDSAYGTLVGARGHAGDSPSASIAKLSAMARASLEDPSDELFAAKVRSALNDRLAVLPIQPSGENLNLTVPEGLTAVSGTGGRAYKAKIPEGGKLVLNVVADWSEGMVCAGGCCACQRTTTPLKSSVGSLGTSSFGLIFLAAMLRSRRRR